VTGDAALARSGYLQFVRVRFHECDPLGHVNNAVYLNYLEQIAIDHAASVGWPAERLRTETGAVFVARRHEIEYLRPALEGDVLRVRTWPQEMSGARGFRIYDVTRATEPPAERIDRLLAPEELAPAPRGEILVRARTEWAFMNVTTGRPQRIPPEVVVDFLTSS
jgi:acyl-CoA thioester hydrolase